MSFWEGFRVCFCHFAMVFRSHFLRTKKGGPRDVKDCTLEGNAVVSLDNQTRISLENSGLA